MGNLWKGGSSGFRYSFVSNMGISQASRVYYNHHFDFTHTQALIKNKLFASVEITNPFDSRMTVRNQITGVNFRLSSSRELLGRVCTLTLRWNFGRLRDRVADAEKMADDTSRTIL